VLQQPRSLGATLGATVPVVLEKLLLFQIDNGANRWYPSPPKTIKALLINALTRLLFGLMTTIWGNIGGNSPE
jgi:hypothetical protein